MMVASIDKCTFIGVDMISEALILLLMLLVLVLMLLVPGQETW